MRHARTSDQLDRRGKPGKVHLVPPYVQRNIKSSLCGTLPTGGLAHPDEVGRWRSTADAVDCKRCLARLERIVDTALAAGVIRVHGYELVVNA